MYEHTHHHRDRSSRQLFVAVGITFAFAAVEAVTGIWANSLALMSDAGHMITDSTALLLAAVAARLAQKPATHRHTFGFGRAEILAAIFNASFMLAVVAGIIYGAVHRIMQPPDVKGSAVIMVAALGLLLNISIAVVLSRGERTINIRGALLHVMGDLLGSVAALASGMVIYFSGWMLIDPLLSLAICVLILVSALRLLKEALHIVMEGVPHNLNLAQVGKSMAQVSGVHSVHDLHIWRLDSHSVALSAHVVVESLVSWEGVLARLREHLLYTYNIDHITLQPEPLTQPLRRMAWPKNADGR